METITISVARFYGNVAIYGVMPRAMFASLEAAFLSGSPVAVVRRKDLQIVLSCYAS
jgi:hypothetical protein